MVQDLAVVFDANVWIKGCVGRKAGIPPPPQWWAVNEAVPYASAIAAMAAACAPLTANVEIFTDELLDDLVLRKLTQPRQAARAEDTGLGWDEADARTHYEGLLEDLHALGRSVRVQPAAAAEFLPGLDYEDQRVWGLTCRASGASPWADSVLVTLDRQFAEVVNEHRVRLPSGAWSCTVMSPGRFARVVGQVRAA